MVAIFLSSSLLSSFARRGPAPRRRKLRCQYDCISLRFLRSPDQSSVRASLLVIYPGLAVNLVVERRVSLGGSARRTGGGGVIGGNAPSKALTSMNVSGSSSGPPPRSCSAAKYVAAPRHTTAPIGSRDIHLGNGGIEPGVNVMWVWVWRCS